MAYKTLTSQCAKVDLDDGDTIFFEDAPRNRSIEIELDQFDTVYRVTIKHDPEDSTQWYHFSTEDEVSLDHYLLSKGLGELKRSQSQRFRDEYAKELYRQANKNPD